ncbi:MAG TPA: aldose epimerase [Firmicutes bacterium]|jgi:galactose mutarotase-like enzyme|nr:aldose epimerase [Bacillota bacterium]
MNKILRNEFCTAEITNVGAELVSLKKLTDNFEYIWSGDKKFWTGHAPVLFPIVCALKNGETKIDGVSYKIGNHGFARKSEFELSAENETRVIYRLSSNKDTLAMYPFQFNLYITYTLSQNKLTIEYKVENVDEKIIYFQIGTHPGFNCPMAHETEFADYYIEFEYPEKLERLYLDSANLIISGKSKKLELKSPKLLPLNHELFNEGALAFKNLKSQKVSLKSDKTSKEVILTYSNLPHMGIWQPKDAPFVCIEPWHGLADTDNFSGEFREKELMISLAKETEFICSYTIEIN